MNILWLSKIILLQPETVTQCYSSIIVYKYICFTISSKLCVNTLKHFLIDTKLHLNDALIFIPILSNQDPIFFKNVGTFCILSSVNCVLDLECFGDSYVSSSVCTGAYTLFLYLGILSNWFFVNIYSVFLIFKNCINILIVKYVSLLFMILSL